MNNNKDERQYTLNIDPRILELLGPNLYTNIYYVLAELIANAYDANASNVYIVVEKDSITVEDDGNGMSYSEGDVDNFLNVAKETRTGEEDSYVNGSSGQRRKMGRKGVGKLAALSVSENVEIKTVKAGEKSGFILSRHIGSDKKLVPLKEEDIQFLYVRDHGTSIVMREPQYDLHRTMSAAKSNLLRIFPMVDESFRIHLQKGRKIETIDNFEHDLIGGLACLITLGEDFSRMHDHFDCGLPRATEQQKESLAIRRPAQLIRINNLKRKDGSAGDYQLEIRGWIGAYRSTKGRKQSQVDFPDNFISILSNNKLGEFNILPIVGKNALNEVYIVGQLHINLFEDSTLPDMALSNRQGYKSDDRRYVNATKYIRDTLLPEVISLRTKYTALKKQAEESEKNKQKVKLEEKLKEGIESFKQRASSDAAKRIAESINSEDGMDQESIEKAVGRAINAALPDMGIKTKVDGNKKKLLISHASNNKAVGDFVFSMLTYSGIPATSIIYTSNDDAISRIPESESIFDYLRDFFVNSYSTEKIYVLYVTSDDMAASWACVSEVGAGWVLKSEHNIFNINNHSPRQPLNIQKEWANIQYNDSDDSILLTKRGADVLAVKLDHISRFLGHEPPPKPEILSEIRRKVIIQD